jgi:hypothetical protein
MPEPQHIAFPLQVVNGQLLTVDQDSPEDVATCVRTMLNTPLGWSDTPRLADMGLTRQEFRMGGPDLGEINGMLERHESRERIEVLQARPDLLDEALSVVNVRLASREV